jgi:hypothetical protein
VSFGCIPFKSMMLEFMVESRDPSLLCATSSCAQKKGQRGSRSDEAALQHTAAPAHDFPQFGISKELSVSQNLLPVPTHVTLSLLAIVHIRQGTTSIRSNKTHAETPVCQKAVTNKHRRLDGITGGSSTRQPDEGVDRCDIADTFASMAPRAPIPMHKTLLYAYVFGRFWGKTPLFELVW